MRGQRGGGRLLEMHFLKKAGVGFCSPFVIPWGTQHGFRAGDAGPPTSSNCFSPHSLLFIYKPS